MAALSWLLIPLTAAVAAAVWGSWAGRRRTTTPDSVGVAGYERFRAAMERSNEEPAAVQASAPIAPGAHAVPAADGPARAAD